jgi:hypothetical protein
MDFFLQGNLCGSLRETERKYQGGNESEKYTRE